MERNNFRYSVMFVSFRFKKSSYYLNITLLFRSQEPEPVLKFAWSRSRKIKKDRLRQLCFFTFADERRGQGGHLSLWVDVR